MKTIHLLLLIVCSIATIRADVADLVIFSFDRPLQLYALLESIEKHVKGVGESIVIYRASDANYQDAYEVVQKRFSRVKFLVQGAKPREDFKPLTLHATFDSSSQYVIFAVDDIVVKDDVDLSMCIELLERTQAYGFYLRMGEHLNYCYTMNQAQRVPVLTSVQDDVVSWVFGRSEADWGYPHTVDMTVFRKKDIEDAFRSIDYYAPNTLEGRWAGHAGPIMNRQGLCFKNSKIVNLPLNRVQNEWNNRSMEISAAALLSTFQEGYRLDIAPLFQIKNLSAHMEYEPTFIQR